MTIISLLLKIYLLIVGFLGIVNTIRLLGIKIDGSLGVVASVGITLFISVAYIYFAWELDSLLPKRKHFVQGVMFISLCNAIATAYVGSLGQNQVTVFAGISNKQLLIHIAVLAVIYAVLIYIVEKLSRGGGTPKKTTSRVAV